MPQALLGMLLAATLPAVASPGVQSAELLGYQTTISTSQLNQAQSVLVDANGDIFIADTADNRVIEESPVQTGYTESLIGSGLSQPSALALDASGNLYIADTGNNRVLKEAPGDSGYSQTVVDANVQAPAGIAVDSSGNLFVSSSGSNLILKETVAGATYTPSTVTTSALSHPHGVALDASGDLFIADTGNNRVLEEKPSNSGYTESTLATDVQSPMGLASDAGGNIYIADSGNNRILIEYSELNGYQEGNAYSVGLSAPAGVAVDSAGSVYIADTANSRVVKDFSSAKWAPQSVGHSGPVFSAIFDFGLSSTSVKPLVVMQGAQNLDYTDAGTGTCTTNGTSYTYSLGQTCTVDITFTPRYPGVRYGAVELVNSSTGQPFVTAYLQGVGVSPEVNFSPPQQVTVPLTGPGLQNAYRIVADGAGNLYLDEPVSAYNPANQVVKETWNNGAWTQSVVASGFDYPIDVAVDGAGNVYVADSEVPSYIYKETPVGGSYVQSTVDSNVGSLQAIAVDSAGNVFAASVAFGIVEEQPNNSGSYTREIVSRDVYASHLAVDSKGNLFAYSVQNITYEFSFGKSGVTQTTIASGYSIFAVDPFDNLYLLPSEFGDSPTILKETPSGTGYVQSTVTGFSGGGPYGLAVDSLGNFYGTKVGPQGAGQVTELDYSDAPSLTFRSTAYGATSTDSPQSVTLTNAGNSALDFPASASGSNPSISSGFTLEQGGISDCPSTMAGAATPTSLAAGSSCNFSVSFTPAAVGAITGSLTLTDNDLNQATPAYATQSVALTGTGAQATPAITWSTPSPITYGTALSSTQLDAASTVAGTFMYSPASGAVLTAGTQTLTANFTPVDSTDYTTATATVTLTVNPATPTITWTMPAAIVQGTPLGSTQLNATASVAGSFFYSPAAGTALSLGTHTLTATFTPTDSTNYTTATASTSITVINPAPGISSFSPAIANAGAAALTLTINGSGFESNSTVNFGSSAVPTTYVSGTQLTAQIPATAIASAGVIPVTVVTPAPGGGTSNSLDFEVDSASSGVIPPQLASTTATVTAGSAASYAVTLPYGATNVSVSCLNLPAGASCSYSGSTLTVNTTSSTPKGSYQIIAVFSETIPVTTAAGMSLPFLLMPFFSRRKKQKDKTRMLMVALMVILSCLAFAGLSGCGGNSSSNSSPPPAKTQTVTSSVGVTLTVQ